MSIDGVVDLLRCPVCHAALGGAAPVLRCPAGHAFDVARQGHVNLLGSAQPRHADTPAMVAAREDFQAAGGLAEVTAELVAQVDASARTVVDAGSGPGHHLSAVLEASATRRGLALDISVAAVRRAARRDRVGAVVADLWQPWPVVDEAADAVLSVFAPRPAAEFARVLRPGGGRLVTVTPGPDHLHQLRDQLGLLELHPDKQDQLAARLGASFATADGRRVAAAEGWSRSRARASVLMGPNAFHLEPDELDRRLDRLDWPLEVATDCWVQSWTRR